jgi:hypothetical protein
MMISIRIMPESQVDIMVEVASGRVREGIQDRQSLPRWYNGSRTVFFLGCSSLKAIRLLRDQPLVRALLSVGDCGAFLLRCRVGG